jgi:fibronectin type 3 domain-containing protein
MVAVVLVGVSAPACMSPEGDGSEGTLQEEVALPPPTNLAVTVVSSTGMDLTWDASPGAAKYILQKGATPGSEVNWTSVASNSFQYHHLTANTQYCWTVVNVNAQGLSSAKSNEVCANTGSAPTMTAPTGVVATATSSSRITVTWGAVTGATSYQIFQSIPPAATVLVGSVTAPTVTYNATGLTPSTTYGYEIKAIGPAGTSAASTPLATATTFALGIEVYYKFDEKTGTTAMDASGFARNGTLAGGAAFTATDKPNVDPDASAMDLPSTVTAKVTSPNVSAFNLSSSAAFTVAAWVKIPTAGTDFHIAGMRNTNCGTRGWEIGQDANNNLYFALGSSVRSMGSALPVGTWTHVAVTFANGTLTTYVNGVSTSSSAFNAVNSVRLPLTIGHVGDCAGGEVKVDEFQILSRAMTGSEVAAIGTLPAAPTALTVAVPSSTRMDLSWTSSVASPTKYIIYKGTAAGNETFFTSSPGTTTTYSYGHLTASTQYSWQVVVEKAGLFSNKSNEVIATTLAGIAAPTNLAAQVLSTTRIKLTWTAVTGAVRYNIYQSKAGGAYAPIGTSTTPTFTAANLTTMTQYSYQVQAVDVSSNVSPFSTAVSATTL